MESGLWRKLLGQYGQKVSLCRGEARVQVRAFFQPVREKAPGEEPTVLGIAPVGKWLYLGPAEEKLEDVDTLIWADRQFRPIRKREYAIGEETLYRWAVAEEMDGECEV